MPIKAAIFDCDGTLVDSMPLWHDVTVELLRRHHVADAEEAFVRTESLPMVEMCHAFHDEWGVEAEGEELVRELVDMVREGYRSRVSLLPGCRAFLDELASAGVRMVVASSTAPEELSVALSAQGVDGYFERVFSTGGPIRSKDYPDIWELVLDYLGTDPADTWVFEDAPFGMRTARSVGANTVCLFSPHGDRDLAACERYADILVHSYHELSLALLDDYARPPQASPSAHPRLAPLRVLVVGASPERPSSTLLRSLAASTDYVIAADAGADALRSCGIAPDVFCGDADSATGESAAWARSVARADIEFPSEKYATDLALAISCACHEAARRNARLELTLTGVTGGRPDHALAVVGQLARNADASPRIVEDGFECRLLSPSGTACWELGGAHVPAAGVEGTLFSAIPVAEGTMLSERGFKWELDHRELPLLGDEGISNVVTSATASVECHAGAVAAFLLA